MRRKRLVSMLRSNVTLITDQPGHVIIEYFEFYNDEEDAIDSIKLLTSYRCLGPSGKPTICLWEQALKSFDTRDRFNGQGTPIAQQELPYNSESGIVIMSCKIDKNGPIKRDLGLSIDYDYRLSIACREYRFLSSDL